MQNKKAMDRQDIIQDRWVLIDTETTGLCHPVYPIEIAAQVMRGWETEGEPFKVLINFDVPIEPGAVKVHRYTRNYLKRCGASPQEALEAFRRYAGELPMAAYNLSFDWDKVIVPTFIRMNMPNPMQPGFCVLKLVRNVVPGLRNYRLITVLKTFGITDKQNHHALDDVNIVIRLLKEKIGPHLQKHRVHSIEEIKRCAEGTMRVPPLSTFQSGWPGYVKKTAGIEDAGCLVETE